MAGEPAASERTRVDLDRARWPEAYRRLHGRDLDGLGAGELEALADAAWWMSRVEESLAVRRRAHANFVAAGDARRAGYNAWMLATEYGFVGKPALAAGWLTRARGHLADQDECPEQGFVAFTGAELAAARGEGDEALRLAQRTVGIGVRCDSRDVVALGRVLEGELFIRRGEVAEGLARLDDAMCDVIEGVLSELVTGWLYCLAVPICFQLPDLSRASEWNAAAMGWCEQLPAGTPFHGLCRVHHAELLGLSGALEEASTAAELASAELMDYHPNMAGESFYVAGELRRRRGDAAGAEAAFLTAHELGRDPQPGLGLLRLWQGRADAAAAALRSCLAGGHWGRLERARLLAAQTEVALALADLELATGAADELETIADGSGATLLEAYATMARGAVAVAREDVSLALERLRRARTLWLGRRLPYEAAQARVLLAAACRVAGDDDTADIELRAARTAFEQLGARHALARVDGLLSAGAALPGGLTPRQLEVLRLVANGKNNRNIAAELVISEHTVSRHLENIYAKLGVSSRAAATTFVHTHDLA